MLSAQFLRHYPDAYIDNGFVVVKHGKAVYHPGQRMMIRWDRGFNDHINDEHELIRYGVYPCDVHTSPNGDTWVSNERVATFTKVITVDDFNQLMAQCQQSGYVVLHSDASTDPTLVSAKADAELQSECDRFRVARTMKANGFA
jgi:hypothetical protein